MMQTSRYLLIQAAILMTMYLSVSPALAQTKSAGLMNFSSDGRHVACSNRDSGTVTILAWPGLEVLHEIRVGSHPEGVAWIGKSSQLACCVYGDDKVVLIDAVSGKIRKAIEVFDEPYGVVSSSDGKVLFVTLEYPGQVIRINPESAVVEASWSAGRMPRGLALSGDDSFLLVTEYLTSRLLKLSAADGAVQQTWEGTSTDNLARQVVLAPSGEKAYFTHIRSRVTASHGNGSIFPYVSVARLSGEKNGTRLRVPMDSLRGARVTANPWDCDVSADGNRLCVVFAGTNDLYVARILGDDFVELDYENGIRLGNNPRAVRFTPNGQTALVYNALDFEVVEYNLQDGSVVARASVTRNPLSDELLLGKKLFYTALQPMSSRNWISCASCHPDGDADGRTWQQPEGLRSTQPLAGLSWTHPVHWSADRDEVQDFEHTIRGKLMQGQGLLKGKLPDALAEPISGRSEALDALAAYTNSHKYSMSPHAKNGLSDAAKRGRDLFFSETTKCATCHTGPVFSDSQPTTVVEFRLHDVGTGGDDPSELMGPKYDTPTLLSVYRSAPYLHHGKAATLEDVLTTANNGDRHGKTSQLTTSEVADLVEFLKSLPYEDPEPAAKAAGLKQVIR
jgi:DNA-binding beta-propeller fold protein YncE/mono/diheme cytochrome c family protein